MTKKLTRWGVSLAVAVFMLAALLFLVNPFSTRKAYADNDKQQISSFSTTWGKQASLNTIGDVIAAMRSEAYTYGNVKYFDIADDYNDEDMEILIYESEAACRNDASAWLGDTVAFTASSYYITIYAPDDAENGYTQAQSINETVYVKTVISDDTFESSLTSQYGETPSINPAWLTDGSAWTGVDPEHTNVLGEIYFVDAQGVETDAVSASSSVGTYNLRVRLVGEDASRYVLNKSEYTYTVSPKELIPTVKVYGTDITTNPELYYTGSALPFTIELSDGGDIFNPSDATAYIDHWAGEVTEVVNAGTYSNPVVALEGAGAGNYVLSGNGNITATITVGKRVVSISVQSSTRYAGEATNPNYTVTSVLSAIETAAGVSAQEPALTVTGKETAVGAGYTLRLTLNDADNYDIKWSDTTTGHNYQENTYEIIKAFPTITITQKEGVHWYYRQEVTDYSDIFDVVVTGVKGETLEADFDTWKWTNDNWASAEQTGFPNPATSNAGLTSYGVRIYNVGTDNYEVDYESFGFMIEKAPVYLRTTDNLTYNGSNQTPTIVYYIYQVDASHRAELVRSDLEWTNDQFGINDTSVAAAGEHQLQARISSTLNDNYEIVSDGSDVFTIAKKQLAISSSVVFADYEYGDENIQAAFPTLTFSGLEGEDNIDSLYYATTWYYSAENLENAADGWKEWTANMAGEFTSEHALALGTYYVKLVVSDFTNYYVDVTRTTVKVVQKNCRLFLVAHMITILANIQIPITTSMTAHQKRQQELLLMVCTAKTK